MSATRASSSRVRSSAPGRPARAAAASAHRNPTRPACGHLCRWLPLQRRSLTTAPRPRHRRLRPARRILRPGHHHATRRLTTTAAVDRVPTRPRPVNRWRKIGPSGRGDVARPRCRHRIRPDPTRPPRRGDDGRSALSREPDSRMNPENDVTDGRGFVDSTGWDEVRQGCNVCSGPFGQGVAEQRCRRLDAGISDKATWPDGPDLRG